MTMQMEKLDMKTLRKVASAICLAATLACGGGGGGSNNSGGSTSPNAASKLAYSDPTPTSGQWALKKNPSSTDAHLILDLIPPSDAVAGFGVGFTLSAPSGSVTWAKVSGSDAQFVHNDAYTLGSGVQLIKGTVKSGVLTAGVFQKGLSTTPVSHGAGAVASVALDLTSGAQKASSVAITVNTAQELQAAGMQPVTVAVGNLSLQ